MEVFSCAQHVDPAALNGKPGGADARAKTQERQGSIQGHRPGSGAWAAHFAGRRHFHNRGNCSGRGAVPDESGSGFSVGRDTGTRTETERTSGVQGHATGSDRCYANVVIQSGDRFITRGTSMSLGKAMIHARKQKSAARAAAHAAESGTHAGLHATHILQMPVLVLNASYEPINICGARRALVLVLKGIARTEEEHGTTLHAQRSLIAMPSVIRLLEYRRIPHQTRALSRKNILLRDRNQCQYCGVVLPSSELTLDHVVPRSRGGNSTWENLVACCHACNRRKGNRMLSELDDMILLREPRPFSLHTSRQIMRMLGRGDDRWRKYLFY